MLRGHLDSLTSTGYVAGWAFDAARPLYSLTVSVLDADGEEVAWGLAYRFREDLAAASCGGGWCAFRLKLAVSPRRLQNAPLRLIDRPSGAEIYRVHKMFYMTDGEAPIGSLPDLLASDPTVVHSLEQLKGCSDAFNAYIRTHGVAAFIRAVYVYMLGRPADADGLAHYGKLLRKNELDAAGFLQIVYECDEFRARPRLLQAPNTPGFPFRV